MTVQNPPGSASHRRKPPAKSGRAVVQFTKTSTVVQARCTQPGCSWAKNVPPGKAAQAVNGHMGYAHRNGQGKKNLANGDRINGKGETVMRTFGTTKASRNNPVRLTDGREHPVTVRRIMKEENR